MTPTTELEAAVHSLQTAIEGALADQPVDRVKDAENSATLLLQWVAYLQSARANGEADELLEGVRSSIVEVAGYLALSMARPAVHAMRCQLELSLSWLYYSDHPIEWRRVVDHEGEFISRSASLKYLSQHSPPFGKRMKLLEASQTRETRDPYDLLCSHVHGTSGFALATGGELTALVRGTTDVRDALQLQKEVAEYLSDVLLCWLTDYWHDLPLHVRNAAHARLGDEGLKEFTRP